MPAELSRPALLDVADDSDDLTVLVGKEGQLEVVTDGHRRWARTVWPWTD